MVKIQRLFAKTNLIIQVCIFLKKMYDIKKAQEVQMKSHKYWSIGALVSMIGTCYTGYKNMKSAHKYCAFSSLICMAMAIYSGHKMISGKSRKKKEPVSEEFSE